MEIANEKRAAVYYAGDETEFKYSHYNSLSLLPELKTVAWFLGFISLGNIEVIHVFIRVNIDITVVRFIRVNLLIILPSRSTLTYASCKIKKIW